MCLPYLCGSRPPSSARHTQAAGGGFVYVGSGGKRMTDLDTRLRIRSVVIPPGEPVVGR